MFARELCVLVFNMAFGVEQNFLILSCEIKLTHIKCVLRLDEIWSDKRITGVPEHKM